MNVSFNKVGDVYRGEFTVTSDFNLHMEKEKAGNTRVYIKGVVDGEYASANFPSAYSYNAIIDYDFSAVVYPKYLRIDSDVPVKSCVITTN